MSLLELIGKIKVGVWQFWRAVLNANIDLPYHDYHLVNEQSTLTSYVVGANQVDAHGNQHKLFVSKNTLVYSTEDTHVHFNDSRNVAVAILANTWYTFFTNISVVYFPIPSADKVLKLYFEGVLPEEARYPE